MKRPLLASLIGASLAATSVFAADANPQGTTAATVDQAAVISKVTEDTKAAPEKAAEIVKKAIADSKADAQFVAQIVKAAVLVAPEQVNEIYDAAVAVAPDAADITNLMIVALINGDEVAAVQKAKLKAKLKSNKRFVAFLDTTDVTVDDVNKQVKVLVSQEVLEQLQKAQGDVEVKLGNLTYFTGMGYQVIILKKDTQLTQ